MELIEQVKENIKRLKVTISQNYWNPGYIANEKQVLKFYEAKLRELQTADCFNSLKM